MALANVAWILASNGRRVLVIDWDLEAPGLYRFFGPFLPDPTLTETEGLIDFVINFANEAATPREAAPSGDGQPAWFEPLANILPYAVSLVHPFPKPGTIDFVPAGRQGPGYAHRVGAFDWGNFYERMGGGVFLEAAKRQMRASYHYILIDSRTGVSDTSGICTVQMPDILVACFTANNQSIEGTAAVAESVRAQWVAESVREQWEADPDRAGTSRQIYPVLNRVDLFEKDRLERRREYAHVLFDSFLDHLTVTERADYWRAVEIPYVPYYAYEEVLATFGDKHREETSLLAAMERLTAFLTGKEVRQFEQPPTEKERREVLGRYARLGSAKAEEIPDESRNGERREVKVTYDTFLSYSIPDGPAVEELARRLKRAGIEPFLDKWNLIPGAPGRKRSRRRSSRALSCAVFIGPGGFIPSPENSRAPVPLRPWQHEKLWATIEHRRISGSRGGYRVIPVLLPGASLPLPGEEGLPRFLLDTTWVKFSRTLGDEEAFHSLVSAIRGIAPGPVREEQKPVKVVPKGLRSYDKDDADSSSNCFPDPGRSDRLPESIRFWKDRIEEPEPDTMFRVGVIYGPSGCGKSSLVKAGLLPRLPRITFSGSMSRQLPIKRSPTC